MEGRSKAITTRIQEMPINPAAEYQLFVDRLAKEDAGAGAVVMFTGHVRGAADRIKILSLTLEHYPGMTETMIARIAEDSAQKFALSHLTVIHRIGRMMPGETIVIALAAAAHRRDAFCAAEMLVDRLKTQAPFWKKEERATGAHWVAQDEYENINP